MFDGDVIDGADVEPSAGPPPPGAPPVVVRGGKVVGVPEGDVTPPAPAPPPGADAWSELLSIPTLQAFQDESERRYLVAKLAEHGGNVTRTAENIETPRSNLYKKIERYGLRREEKPE